jgi:hypothetical protein
VWLSACAPSAAESVSWHDYGCFFHGFIIAQNIVNSLCQKSEYFVALYDTRIQEKNTKKIVSTLLYAHHLNYLHLQGSMRVVLPSNRMMPVSPHDSHVCA